MDDDENIFDFNSEYQELLADDYRIEDEQVNENKIKESTKEKSTLKLNVLLNCCGELGVSDNSTISDDIEQVFNHQCFDLPQEFEIFNFTFNEDFFNSDLLIALARANIQKLSHDQNFNTSFFALRESVTNFLLILRCNYQDISHTQLNTLRTSLGTFDSIPNFSLLHSSFSSDGNKSSSSAFHLLHGMLEWRWLYLTIIYKVEFMSGKLGNDDSDLAQEVKLFLYDLVLLSISKHQKCNNANIVFTSPFVCGCVKEMWMAMYEFVDRLQDNSLNFWSILTNLLLEDLSSGKNYYEKFPTKKILLRTSQPIVSVLRNSNDLFPIWFMSDLMKLVARGETNSHFEAIIKNFLKNDKSEENLRVMMMLAAETILNVGKVEILLHMWEVYQKKINSAFLIAGQSPNYLQLLNNTAGSLLEQLKKQQAVPINKLNINSTSYTMFIYVLGKIIEKFTLDSQRIQIQKILGRILMKFPVTKIEQLNEMGIHNLLKLLLTIVISTDFNEVSQKVTNVLLQIPLEKANHQQHIMRGHTAMIMLYCENHQNVTQYVTKLMAQVNIQVQKSNASNILKGLAEALPQIFLKNEEIFKNGEHILFDTWIIKHLQNCTTVEKDRLYESLTRVIQKIRSENVDPSIISKMFEILLPMIEMNFSKSDSKIDSVWIPKLAANLCLLTLDSQNISGDIPKFETLFKTIIDVNSKNFEVSIKFMTYMLNHCQQKEKLDVLLIMQNWIKFSILLGGGNEVLKELTKCVIKTEEFMALQSDQSAAATSKEPLMNFIACVGKKYGEANNQGKFALIEKLHSYLLPFEKWALPILQQNASQKTPNSTPSTDEFVMRIYTFIAITFLHCSELIYIRSKTSCFFNVAVLNFILPSSLMSGQSQQPRAVTVAIHKVFPLLIEGISRLNYKSDQHIAKVLGDVILKWCPLLKVSNNSKFVAKPFIGVSKFKNYEVVEFFWGKLAKNFIAMQTGKKPSPYTSLILTMIEEVMHEIEGEEQRVVAIWKNLMQHIIESSMLLDEIEIVQRTSFTLFQRFIKNKNFETSNAMRNLVSSNLEINTSSTLLSYHSGAYFRFINKVCKLEPKIVANLLPHLMLQIQKVEQLRGGERDIKLRNFHEQLLFQCKKV